jgi:hypothetical protein
VRTLADEMFSNSVIEDVVGISVDGTSVDGTAVDGETIVVHGVAGETH